MSIENKQVVADASVLIHLASIGQFERLALHYRALHIPERVYKEVVVDGWGLSGSQETKKAVNEKMISIDHVDNHQQVRDITQQYRVSTTNAEVIQLAVEREADLVLADEEEIRTAARDRGIDVKGCLGILIESVKKESLKPAEAIQNIDNLVDSGYRIDKRIIQSLKERLRTWDQ